jgi:[ribosomal protein S5]-alanine N-acetyltransferase
MNSKLVIKGKFVTLSSFQKDDISRKYLSWLNDKEVVKFSNQRFVNHNILSSKKYLKSFSGSNNLFLSIKLTENNQMIGTMTAYFSFHNTVDVGIMIGEKSLWGNGYGKDAWNTLLFWLEKELNVRKITAGTLASNKGMLKLMKQSAMSLEATKKDHEMLNNQPEDALYFCKFNNSDK